MPVEKLFPDFEIRDWRTSGATIHCLRKGSGPPLLLLHGYPQTHVIWHKIANRLSQRYTVVLTDLRGYGDSSKPDGGPRHENYSFRAMAQDQVDLMRQLGYDSFFLGAHDRGARVAHRMCLDHPEAVLRGLPHGHYAHSYNVPRNQPGIRNEVHVVVFPHPEGAATRAHDRRRLPFFPGQALRDSERDTRRTYG
jgi:pimeloyl-ACP methyl ester carboxylesterase